MEYRLLGSTGVRVAPLALGGWNFGDPTPEAEVIRMIDLALDRGLNLIDTADMYGAGESERITGKALQGEKRNRVILATKAHYPTSSDVNDRGNTRRHLFTAVEASLHRLSTDWIDLYQVHRPDFELPQEETLRALNDLVQQGKVRYIGCSTFPAWLVMEALAISRRNGWAEYATEQPPYNLLDRRIENELVPLALRYGLGLLPWSPLASGVLAGRYADASTPPADSRASRIAYAAERVNQPGIEAAREVARLARERGLTPSQLALVWLKDQPGVTAPLLGARTLAQLEEALPVLELNLDPETAAALDVIAPPGNFISDFHNTSGWTGGAARLKIHRRLP